MLLSERHIQILSYLINEKSWVTSEKLSSALSVNKKTIQAEIKNISNLLGEECQIKKNNRNGYILEYFSPKVEAYIINELSEHEEHYSLSFRASVLLTYLLFQQTYTSMQSLADTFFLSKTAVSLEVKTIERWIERYPGFLLEISGTEGLKILATEEMRREYLSLICTYKVFSKARLGDEYIKMYEIIFLQSKEILKDVLIRHDYIISGKDFFKLSKYITITILRSKMGFKLESLVNTNRISTMMNYLANQILTKINYKFSFEEEQAFQHLIYECNTFYESSIQNKNIEDELRLFENKIIDLLHLQTNFLFEDSALFINHVMRMKRRITAGHVSVNYFSDKITRVYPLETYLIKIYFPICFNLRPSFPEISYLALYLATALERYKTRSIVLLVSNQSLSVINRIKTKLQSSFNNKIGKLDVIPGYQFEANKNIVDNYELLLATENEILFLNKKFIFINSIMSNSEEHELLLRIEKSIEEHRKHRKKQIMEKCFPEENVFDITRPISNLYTLFPKHSRISFHAADNGCLFVCSIDKNITSSIKHFKLKYPVMFKKKKFKSIVFAEFNEESEEIFLFFNIVSDILNNV